MLETEKAYIAGLLDGEGTISFKEKWVSNFRVSIANTDVPLLEWVQSVVGFGRISTFKPHTMKYTLDNGKVREYHCRPVSRIDWVGRGAELFLSEIVGYLVLKRQKAIMFLTAFYELEAKINADSQSSRYRTKALYLSPPIRTGR